MSALIDVRAEQLALLFGLSLFFGFAFEEFYSKDLPFRPGGVRTFPLLALAGGALYLLDEQYKIAFVAGLIVLGAWLYARLKDDAAEHEEVEGVFVIPVANVLAYVLGAIALTQPLWLCVSFTVGAVLLLSGKKTLHELADRVPGHEIATAGKFLILVGVVLPLVWNLPKIPYTTVTPVGVWLSVIAVSSISYLAYLLQNYVFTTGGTELTALIGGLYSSTAVTVAVARRARSAGGMTPELQSSTIAATGMMYFRLLAVCAIFNVSLARALMLPLIVPGIVALGAAFLRSRTGKRTQPEHKAANPLEIGTALTFAALMVFVSLVTSFVMTKMGAAGVLGLSAIVGVTDIDPFVLSLAQGGASTTGISTAALAIVIAAASNNALKAIYSVAFSRARESWIPAVALVALGLLGIALGALLLPR